MVEATVGGKFGMEGSGEGAALLDEDWFVSVGGQNVNTLTDAADDRGADKHRFQIGAVGHLDFRDLRVDLAAVGVALDGYVHDSKGLLLRMVDFGGEQDGSGAGAEDGAAETIVSERFKEVFDLKEL